MGGEIRFGRGPRAVETLLLEAVAELAGEVDPTALARPVRVIVPSRSLRDHVAARVAGGLGHAVLGLRIQTLYGAAAEVAERAGAALPRGDLLLPIAVRRAARAEPALRSALDDLHDGYAVVTAAVADLLDAGLEVGHAETLRDAIRGTAGSRHETARSLAALEVALRVSQWLASHGLGRALERAGPGALPSRAVLVHGFAEATGRASAWIDALRRVHGAVVLLDRPPDPLDPRREDPAAAFTERLLARLGVSGRPEPSGRGAGPPAQLTLVRAPGAEAEVRAAADAIRTLLDGGAPPEGIGVVARTLGPYALALRRHFGRLGIPYSDRGGHGPPAPESRRVQALVELLAGGDETPADRWLDALGWIPELGSRRAPEPPRNALRRDLALALHALGAARLRDVAELDVAGRLGDARSFPLPVRRGLSGEDGRAERRHLGREVLETAVRRAGRVRARLAEAARAAPAAEHRGALQALAVEELGWGERVPGCDAFRAALHQIESGAGGAPPLDAAEWTLLVRRAVDDARAAPLGGAGAGVQVLDVTEARARTFEHLFALGLNRDVFPRAVREDPLLPDRAREALRAALPEMPVKRAGHQEEAYLFAQLVASSPRVTVSWQTRSDDGDARAASSFVERHRIAYPDRAVAAARPALAPRPGGPPRPPHEHAVLAGLHGTRARFGESLRAALGPERGAAAAARLAVLAEQDPDRPRTARPGPYFGFVGRARDPGDPRRGPVYATTLESVSRCPWQTLLTRVLRVQAPPDALDALPALDPRTIGNAVHAALERICTRDAGASGGTLDEAAARAPVAVSWPSDAELDRIVAEAARDVLATDGVALAGAGRALAASARPRLEAARDLLWSGGARALEVAGTEVEGELELVPGRGLRFKVDLVERAASGLRLCDYKTGAARWDAVRPHYRRSRFVASVRRGESLQAVAYALAAPGAEGRYVYLRPELEPERAVYAVPPEPDEHGGELREAFAEAARALLEGWDAGAFFPRLVSADGQREPYLCERCEVSEACLRGDSGARARLAGFARDLQREVSDPEAALRGVWDLQGLS